MLGPRPDGRSAPQDGLPGARPRSSSRRPPRQCPLRPLTPPLDRLGRACAPRPRPRRAGRPRRRPGGRAGASGSDDHLLEPGRRAGHGRLAHPQVDTALPVLARLCAARGRRLRGRRVPGRRGPLLAERPGLGGDAARHVRARLGGRSAHPVVPRGRRRPRPADRRRAPGWGTAPGLVLEHGGRVLGSCSSSPWPARAPPSRPTSCPPRAALRRRRARPRPARPRRCWSPPTAASCALPSPPSHPQQSRCSACSPRAGPSAAIGSRLGISQSTVDKHVRDLYRRLGTQDRASTIRTAQVRGLLDGLVGEDWQDLLIGET